MPKSLTARLVAAISLLLVLAIGVYMLVGRDAETPASSPAMIGGGFTLTDQQGTKRSDAEFRGKLMLVYFGFTNCPDVCPLALQKMTDALDALGDKAAGVMPIFITVDPERDTVEAMRDYVANFHPSLVALTGDEAAAEAAAKAYRVYAEAAGGGGGDYTVMHSSIVYLMGRDGGYIAHFGDGGTAEEIAQRLAKEL